MVRDPLESFRVVTRGGVLEEEVGAQPGLFIRRHKTTASDGICEPGRHGALLAIAKQERLCKGAWRRNGRVVRMVRLRDEQLSWRSHGARAHGSSVERQRRDGIGHGFNNVLNKEHIG